MACNKTTTSPTTSIGSPTVANTGTPASTITPIPLQNFSNATFTFFTQQILVTTNPLIFKATCNGQATFFNGTSNTNSVKTTVQAVYLDSVPLSFYSSNTSYSSPNIAAGNCTWQIYGSGNIPSFTYAGNQIPRLVNYTSLPDTIDHTKPLPIFLQFSIGHGGNATIFFGNNHTISASASVYATDTAHIYFSASTMSGLSVGSATLSFDADYYDQESVNNIPMLFYNKNTFNKVVYIK